VTPNLISSAGAGDFPDSESNPEAWLNGEPGNGTKKAAFSRFFLFGNTCAGRVSGFLFHGIPATDSDLIKLAGGMPKCAVNGTEKNPHTLHDTGQNNDVPLGFRDDRPPTQPLITNDPIFG